MWAAGVACGLALGSAAAASPPSNDGRRSPLATSESRRAVSGPTGVFPPQEHTPTPRLDLRLPANPATANIRDAAAGGDLVPFPSRPDRDGDTRTPLPTLSAGELNYRTMSQAEILARRVHREGLPMARLWQSKSALLSIGLNNRGKPGLWLTQKIP